MDPEFWHARWRENRIGFHQPDTSALLIRHWQAPAAGPGGNVLVPLCGKSLDMLWLLDQGYRVTGVELSRIAVEAFFAENRLAPIITRDANFIRYRCDELELLCGDFLALDNSATGHIDAVYDRASLTALPPAMRPAYVRQLTALLDPGTPCLLITLVYDQQEMQGPPFSVPGNEISRLYEGGFEIMRLDTLDVLADEERFRKAGVTELLECAHRLTRR